MTSPYQILGVKNTDSIEHITDVYAKFMKVLHPDKANTKEAKALNLSYEDKLAYYNMIQQAYKTITSSRKQDNYPDYGIDYKIDDDMRVVSDIPADADSKKFNQKFDERQQVVEKAGMNDPYSRGYNEFSNGKDFNNLSKVTPKSYSMDVQITTPKLHVPDMKDNSVVEYIPEFTDMLTNSSIKYNELGLVSVSDFSFTGVGKGSLHGTDLMSVYGQNFENWEDTVKRDKRLHSKFSDETNITKKMSQIESDRAGIYSAELDRKMLKEEVNRNKTQMLEENMRNMNLRQRDGFYNELNLGRLNNGVPPR